MPHKGSFTQGICVLLEGNVAIDAVAECLASFDVCRIVEAGQEWAFGGPTAIVPYRPDVNGYCRQLIADALKR